MNAFRLILSAVACLSFSCISTSAQAAERLLTIGGAVTEIVFALGKSDEIIASDITSYYPDAARKQPKIGYMRTLSAEGLLSMRPTLIIADAGAGPVNVLDQVRSAGVNVVQLNEAYTPEHVANNIRIIGKHLHATNSEKIASEYEADWQRVQARVNAFKTSPRVLFVLDHTGKSPQTAGNDTAANAVISLAHATNVMTGQFKGYKPLTAEAIVAAVPSVIITTHEGMEASGGLESFLDKPGLRMTPAGKAKRVISMDSLLLLGFTPRLPSAIAELSQAVRQP